METTDASAEGTFDDVYRRAKRVAASSNDKGCLSGALSDVTAVIKHSH
jgi:hypothetical protein